MATCDEEVPTVDARDLSPAQFVERYLKPNLPVLITGLTDGWRARREWVVSGSGAPDVGGAMAAHFGEAEVLVVDCDAPLDTDLARVRPSQIPSHPTVSSFIINEKPPFTRHRFQSLSPPKCLDGITPRVVRTSL